MRALKPVTLIMCVGILILACSLSQPQASTLEVTRLVRESYPVTVEVTRWVPKRVLVTVEVTRIVRETVVVPPTVSPSPTMRFTPGVALFVPRTWHTATRLMDNRILLAGGSDGGDAHLAEVETFDPLSGALSQAAFLHTPRHEHTATLLPDGRMLVVGGYNAADQWLSDAEIYDPRSNTWTVNRPLYSHGVQHTATLLKDGRVLVVGGCTGGSICTNRVEIFNPQTDRWSEAAPLGSERASHTATLLQDGRVLIAGGSPSRGDALLYNPQANTWAATQPMLQPVVQAGAVRLVDGRVLVAGGFPASDSPQITAHSEIFDPAANTWTAAASLAQPRYAHLLTMLPDGQVLAIGGAWEYDYPGSRPWTETSFVRSIERYDPRSDRWSASGELPQPLAYPAAAWLRDGRLWLTGGNDAGGARAETWLITPLPAQP
jgi:N-acetylneuraminic acid mutarotase